MKPFKLYYLLLAFALATVFSSCRKDGNNKPDDQEMVPVRKGIFILNEGQFNRNNSSLSYYDYDTKVTAPDQFFTANSRGLGDVGSDVQVYGSKMYIVVNVSNTLEVTEVKTAKSIKKIEFKNGAAGRQPRYIVFNKNKAFVSSYDGTVAVIDTATLTIEKYITVGRNPERIAIANGKLYVANSGGLDSPNFDTTVSVIDLNTLTETKKITVPLNPIGVYADKYGDIYISSPGNYGNILPSLTIIDSKTDLVTKTISNFDTQTMTISGDYAYIAGADYNAVSNESVAYVKLFNVKTETVEKANLITDGTKIENPYSVTVDEVKGEVFVTDAKNFATNGQVFCFGADGVKKYVLNAGVIPSKIVFVNK